MLLNEFAKEVHENAKSHGWYDEPRGIPEVIALMHSELSEALEEYRAGNPLVYYVVAAKQADGSVVPEIRTDYGDGEYMAEGLKPEGVAVELCDAIIRILDTLAYLGVNVEHVLEAKHKYNIGRDYRHGGKRA